MKQLERLNISDIPINMTIPVVRINELIEYTKDLEARLSALEHPVERLSEETAPKCNCMVVNDKRVCPQHGAVITNDHKC